MNLIIITFSQYIAQVLRVSDAKHGVGFIDSNSSGVNQWTLAGNGYITSSSNLNITTLCESLLVANTSLNVMGYKGMERIASKATDIFFVEWLPVYHRYKLHVSHLISCKFLQDI